MARNRIRTAQQRDARELALTRPSNPYRGTLTDPFTPTAPVADPASTDPADRDRLSDRTTLPSRVTQSSAARNATSQPAAVEPVRPFEPLAGVGQPGGATLAGIIGIVLGLTLALFGLLLVTIVSLQDEYGAPDRSFYRGTDSGYVVLGLIDFGLAALCGIGGIVLLTGRVAGRISLTVGGWSCLILAGYWLEDSSIRWFVPVGVAVVAAVMLAAAYTRPVTRWLGVLPAPQPE